jgi:hypothetical protein
MFVLLSTTPHKRTRQMRMKSQNMMVLTLEFTNVSFSRLRRKIHRDPHFQTPANGHSSLDAPASGKVAKITLQLSETRKPYRLRSSKQIVLPGQQMLHG